MKSILLAALLSTGATAQYPPNFIDFRGNSGKGTGKNLVSATVKPAAAGSGGGTGPYKAKHWGDLGFTGHTIYAPVNPPKGQKMPVLVYSNNGGLAIGTIDAMTVVEISSYGYYVIVEGALDAGFTGGPGGGPAFAKSTDGFDAINWVVDQAANGKLPNVDATKIFAGGTSMGGMQSYTTSQDKRVLGTIIISSGLFGGPLRNKLSVLTKPIGYFEGGTSDMGKDIHQLISNGSTLILLIATNNGKQDYAVLKTPATWASGQFGHGMVNAKRAAGIVAWLNWQAKGNATAGRYFTDRSSTYLKSMGYTEVSSKNFK